VNTLPATGRFAARRDSLATILMAQRVDALVCCSPHDCAWLTGTYSVAPVMCVDGEWLAPAPVSRAVKRMTTGHRRLRLGVTGAMPADQLSRWTTEFSGLAVVDCSPAATRLRATKDDLELRYLAAAAAATEGALSALERQLRPGLTELDVRYFIEAAIESRTGQGMSFDASVGSAERTSLVWARPTLRRLDPGDPVLVDVGARLGGYCADMSRTYILDGPVTASGAISRQAAERLEEIRGEVLASLRPGIRGSLLAEVARRAAARAGAPTGLGMPHAIGHGIGLEVHERPYLTTSSDDVIDVNMVIAIEPGLYAQGAGGARVEDMVVVTADGYRALAKTEVTSCAP
jgi:Xaa-Pro aminopeptidase